MSEYERMRADYERMRDAERDRILRDHPEHQRVQAEAAAMRRALDDLLPLVEMVPAFTNPGEPDSYAALVHARDALSSSAGATLLEEMEGLRRANEAMSSRLAPDWSRWIGPCVHGRDPWDRCDTCEEAGEAQSIVWVLDKERKEHAAESADLRARLERAEKERDAAVADLKASHWHDISDRFREEFKIQAEHRAAEVRRAVEEERERIVQMLRARASGWGADTPVGHALEVAAADVLARGKE